MTNHASRSKFIATRGASLRTAFWMSALVFVLSLAGSSANAQMPRTPTPDGASVYLITPSDGETVSSPFTVRFGLRGMGVGPAGLDNAKTGHHHLIIDAPLPPPELPVPTDANHRHFGGGQTEAEIELPPGKHTLQMLLGDKNHVPHTEPLVSEKITITVE